MQQNHQNSPAAAGGGGKEKPEAAHWTEEEEERLLRAALDIAREPVESFDPAVSPVDRVRRAVGGDFTAEEIVRKTKNLRKRYEEMCGQDKADAFGTVFEICEQIWGLNGGREGKEKEGERDEE